MNILYLSDSTLPSISANIINVMKMCQAFSDIGHSVILYAKKGDSLANEIDLYKIYGVKKNFQIKLVNAGVNRISNLIYILFAFSKAIKDESFDLIYTRSISVAFLTVLFDKQLIFELHQYNRSKNFIFSKLLAKVIKSQFLHKLVVISNPLKLDVLNDFPGYFNKILVAHDGADPINSINSRKLNTSSFNICYTGSLYSGKGFEIIYPLALGMPNCEFHVVGGTNMQILRIKEKYSIPTNLHLHGFLEYPKAEKFRIQADILIAPFQERILLSDSKDSDISRWTSPIKLFEYMSTGKTIIASNIPAVREILNHNENAILIPPKNIDEWILKITKIRRNPKKYEHLGINAKSLFLSKYTWQQRAKNIMLGVESD